MQNNLHKMPPEDWLIDGKTPEEIIEYLTKELKIEERIKILEGQIIALNNRQLDMFRMFDTSIKELKFRIKELEK